MGGTLVINHVIGVVAPVTKTVNYGIVLSTLGGTGAKCWITQNLGSSNQATSATDATEAAAGWYWQFNRKQGYKHDGVTRTPNTAWITPINENSDWVAAQDPCTIELGAGWRIPTYTEWLNANANGGWVDYNGDYASVLKIHAAGCLYMSDGHLQLRGLNGMYYSSTQFNNTLYYGLSINSSQSGVSWFTITKDMAYTLRCLKD
jgi:hypothetical protein